MLQETPGKGAFFVGYDGYSKYTGTSFTRL